MRSIIPVVSVAAWIVIGVMAYLNPSGTVPIAGSGIIPILPFVVGTGAAYLLPSATLGVTPARSFVSLFIVSPLILIGLVWVNAILLHRDFFVYGTQVVIIFFTILLVRLDDLGIVSRKKEVFRAVSSGAYIAFTLWVGWLMMMSYAIVTRAEPRWIESTAYNLVNGVIALVLLVTASTLRDREKRILSCREDRFYLDERDISALLTPQECRIVGAFLTGQQNTHTCRSLLEYLRTAVPAGGDDLIQRDSPTECSRCLLERWTASNCAPYRNLKNRISDTKKYLELLQIGTIVPVSENPREIKETGWVLRLFDDVRVARDERLFHERKPTGSRR